MGVVKSDVALYLTDVSKSVREGRYQISARKKNQDMFLDYVFTEEDAKNVILSLGVDDFSGVVKNEHPQHPEEVLYIFGKEITLLPRYGGNEEVVPLYIKLNKLRNQYVIVISLHEQEFPLHYAFKS